VFDQWEEIPAGSKPPYPVQLKLRLRLMIETYAPRIFVQSLLEYLELVCELKQVVL
jgi:hypothetical protein